MTAEIDRSMWSALRQFTAARIGLPRTGASLATAPLLEFKLAHARARDAVHAPLDETRLIEDLARLGTGTLAMTSAAQDRQHFLMRPDLGRRLGSGAEDALRAASGDYDLAFVVSDGLSARAAQDHATPVLTAVVETLRQEQWRIAPVVLVRHGRVAVGDAVAAALNAACVAILIGERPGLTAPDSMGAYLTWRPTIRATDADRNCVSNIRPDGIGYAEASFRLTYLLRSMRAQGFSGVRLKDESGGRAATIQTRRV
jgi:ethanolamine ammonia-lyase small subunit